MTAPAFSPIAIVEVELSQAVPDLPLIDAQGRPHGSAWVLVRLHGTPLGLLRVTLPLDARGLADRIDEELGAARAAHEDADGTGQPPACVAAREAFLAAAPPMSVLIPTRDRPERLERALRSILAGDYPQGRYEILCVDNAPSTDATRRVVDALAGEGAPVRYAREDATGSASARNAGLPLLDTDLVAMTDDDVIVDTHWLTEIARGFSAAEGVAAVSGLLLPGELETPAQVWFEEYGGFSRGFERQIYDLREHRPADMPLYPWSAGVFGTGNNFAFHRPTLQAIGAFDPALGNGTPALGGVDSEALLRTILTGHRIVYQPTALVWHLHRPDVEGLRRQIYAYGAGLTGQLVKTMLAEPRLLPDLLSRVPRGLRFALSPGSEKNTGKSASYPRDLTRLELKGMLYGPLGYARSRRRYGGHAAARHAYRERRRAAGR